jgi:hypothetical protein
MYLSPKMSEGSGDKVMAQESQKEKIPRVKKNCGAREWNVGAASN